MDRFLTPTYVAMMTRFINGDLTGDEAISLFTTPATLDQILQELRDPASYPVNLEDLTFVETTMRERLAGMDLAAGIPFIRSVFTPLLPEQYHPILETAFQTISQNRGRSLDEMIESLLASQPLPSVSLLPASQAVISALPSEATLVSQEVCFCQMDREMGELYDIVTLPCGHQFDRHCITSWLGRCNTCPNCRYPLLTGDAAKDLEVREEWLRRVPSLSPD